MTSWRNVKIDFNMMSPVAITYPWIFFDSVIAHLHYRQLNPDAYRKQDSKIVNRDDSKKLGDNVIYHQYHGVSHGSASVIDHSLATYSNIYSRFDDAELFKLRTKGRVKMKKFNRIRSGFGYYRAHAIKLVTIPCRTVTFYAKCDVEKLVSLLGGLPGLGKKTSIGFGFIKDYTISYTDSDMSVVKDGIAMRSIPIRLLSSWDDEAVMAWTIPYWASKVERCAPPGAKVTKRRGIRL